MATHIDNMTTEVIAEPEPVQGGQGVRENTESKMTDRDLKRKIMIEMRTRARGFDD